MRAAGGAVLLATLLLAPRAARGNGAFPDSQGILLPPTRPSEITLVTNFGLVTSTNAGRSWIWSCEQDANTLGFLYQYGPPPRTRMYALANEKLIMSDDGACGWQLAGGMVSNQGLSDFFPDPSNPDRVLAIGFDHTTFDYAVFASHDGGATFDSAIYRGAIVAGGRTEIDSVEISRSDPHTFYVTTSALVTSAPALARSPDDGVSWQTTDLSATLGTGTARIIGVDPDDPMRALLLYLGPGRQAIALTRDGGKTVTTVLDPGAGTGFVGFARTTSGTILLAAVDQSTNPLLYRSRDKGLTFTRVDHTPPQIRGLAARGNNIYAATNNFGDGYALGLSSDDGDTWQPVMSYDKINALAGCVKAFCQTVCQQEVVLDLFPAAVCSADPPVDVADGGAADAHDGGAPDAATGVGGRGATGGGAGRATTGGGGQGGDGGTTRKSGCAVGGGDAEGIEWMVLGVAIVLALKRRLRPPLPTRSGEGWGEGRGYLDIRRRDS